MAAILSITYTPNYIGCHRICFRTSEIDYCCYLDESPVVIGTPKTISFNLTEDYGECLVTVPTEFGCNGQVIVEGYIQACCVDANSTDDRIVFDAAFSQTECTPYSVECASSGVGSFNIINAGYGWPVGITPTIEVLDSSGDGTGFVGYATMNCLPGENFCSIDDIIITDPGENYFNVGTLTVSVLPPPSCLSEELVIDGEFLNGFADWTVDPFPNGWLIPTGEPIYNLTTYGPAGGTLSQNILEAGKTYIITIEKVGLESVNGLVRFIISAGTFNITGTASNQFMITRNTGDPAYNAGVTTTLTCVGTTALSIYADSVTTNPSNYVNFNNISVVELCTAVAPELEVDTLESCGTFTVPDCSGTSDGTTYALRGGDLSISSVTICSGGSGPIGAKYIIAPDSEASCCNCRLYNVVVANPIDIYYTSCNGQGIEVVSVEAGAIGVTVCAIEGSVWPVNSEDNAEILVINDVGECTENP
jgi:hypothetical protein